MGIGFVYVYIVLSYIGQPSIVDPRLHSLSLYMLLAVSILTIFYTKRFHINHYLIWYVLFLAISLFSTTYAYNANVALAGLYSMIVVLGLAVAITSILRDSMDIKNVLVCFSLSGFLLFTVLLWRDQLFVDERLGESLFGNANIFANLMMLSLICSIWLSLYSQGIKRAAYLFIIMTQVYTLFLSGGRKYILVPALFFYLLLILKKDADGRNRVIRYTVLFALVISSVFWLIFSVPLFYDTIGYRMAGFLDLLTGDNQNVLNGDMERQYMMDYGIDFFKERPITGYGTDNFKILFGDAYGRYVYSHNNFIEMLVNYGVMGFILYYSFYMFLICKLWLMKNDNSKLRDFFLAFMICLLPFEMGVVSYNLYFIQLFICFGSVIVLQKTPKENKKWGLPTHAYKEQF
ncbi:hypothetical protein XYCOK13_25920 [Xylanibacillus composti]|uniref:O-antigen ligase-related domain-containing protein n=2 Tax=Xylanibacillus composti TaxID=1572762 RepID=A0A8J4H758_9BACL|nr:hypothetical protein XYCOK13_25920 [Xylanibacillus composti]